MRDALRRFPLERALQLAIVAVIVTAVLAAGALLSWLDAARKARWVALAALLVLSVPAARRASALSALRAAYLAAGAFVALTLVSALWSGTPRTSLARALSLALLVAAAGCLAAASAGRPDTARRLLAAVLAGTAVVALGGLLVLAFRHDRAVAPATTSVPARYQGLGGGPDTATMILAVGVPLAAWAFAGARRRLVQLGAAAIFVLLLGSIVASGSRGALASAFAGTLAFVLLGETGRARLGAAAGVVGVFALALVITRLPQPAPAGSSAAGAAPAPAGPHARPGYVDANVLIRLQDDIGHPPLGVADTARRPRTLFGTSGRAEAWEGAIDQGQGRPVLGFGFGTEREVFVDRYVGFESDTPESSYIGLFLQLGVVGLGAFLLLVATLARETGRAVRRLTGAHRRLAAACAAVLAAGLVLGFFQSYIYAVGNNATAAVWIGAFLLAATTTRARVATAAG